MATNGYVHWHEGLFLQPHHLQWMQRSLLTRFADERRLAWAHPYGVVEARLSADALENMLVRFDALRVVMPSGLEVHVPEHADLPAFDIKQAFEGTSGGFTVLLGIPLWYASRANAMELGAEGDWRVKRQYRVAEATAADENTGENPQTLLIRRLNARLLLETDDRSDLETIPLLRVARGTGEETALPRQDPAFVPACMVLGASPTLRDLVRDFANQVEASRADQRVKLTRAGFSVETMRGVQFSQMLRLRTLNRFGARLSSLWSAPGVTPFELYLELRELLGDLAALVPDPDQYDAPRYDHEAPMIAFQELVRKIRPLLKAEGQETWLKLEFRKEAAAMVAELSPDHLSLPNEYFLGIRTAQDPRAVARLVEDKDQFKLMAGSMAGRKLYGVKLQEERHPPLELPAQVGLLYFRLNRAESDRMWGQIKTEKKISLEWPNIEGSDFQVTLYMTVPGGGG
ncbi:MAG: type VI secretion system baseplate subunit TssK [Phycisphaerales bacterium]